VNNELIQEVKPKRKGIFVFVLFILLIMTQCERNEFSWEPFDCSTCYQDKPDWGPLQVYVTINDQNPSVPLVIYRGDIEDNDIEYIDTAHSSSYTVEVPVDKYYSVTAEYKDGSRIIFAVDGDKLKLDKNTTDCDEECYYFRGGYIDVRLNN
jgi:hypothetical protein